MEHLTKKDLVELKESISLALENEEYQILQFSAYGSDKDFQDLIKKAIYYRNLLVRIEQQLANF